MRKFKRGKSVTEIIITVSQIQKIERMKLMKKKMKKIVKKPDKNSELWLKSPSGYVTMKLS